MHTRTFLASTLVALGLTGCASDPAAEPERVSGSLADVPGFLSALVDSPASDAFLIIEVDGTADFLQFTAGDTVIELDLPLITPRQQQLEKEFRRTAADLELVVRVSIGSNGARFLDIDLDARSPGTAPLVQKFLAGLYGVSDESPLVFFCHGCRPSPGSSNPPG